MLIRTCTVLLIFVWTSPVKAQPDTTAWLEQIAKAIELQEAQDYHAAMDHAAMAMEFAGQWGDQFPEYAARSYNVIAGCLLFNNQPEEALPLLRKAAQTLAGEGLQQTETYLGTLNWQGVFYYFTNQYDEMVHVVGELIERCRQRSDWKEKFEFQALNLQAAAFIRMARYEDAIGILDACYKEMKSDPTLDDYNLPAVISNLAYAYKQSGKLNDARILYEEALVLQEERYGRMNDNYARMSNNIAKLYIAMGNYDAALPLLRQALEILEQTLGAQHEEYRIQLDNLALLYHKMGKYEEESACFAQILGGIQQTVVQQSGAFSESEQASLLKTTKYFINRIHRKAVRFPQDSLIAKLSYDGILLLKGLMLRNSQRLLSYLSRIESPETKAQLQQWFRLRQEVYRAYLDPAAGQARLDSLLRMANTLESELAYRSEPAQYALRTITWSEVQQSLKPGEAAVEFSLVDVSPAEHEPDFMYMAFVIRPGWSSPRLVNLAKAAQADSIVQRPGARGLRYADAIYNPAVRPQASLYSLLWAPLDSLLAGAKMVFYAPEGVMHQLNPQAWAIDPSRRLADRYRLRRMSSTRLLADPENQPAGPNNALIMGGILYDHTETVPAVTLQNTSTEAEGDRGSAWAFLPHSEQEALAIKKLLSLKGFATEMLTGMDATEQAFKSLSEQVYSPRIIHLASHGYFAPEAGTQARGSRFTASAHPLIRSGLILSGANTAWNSDQLLPEEEDGVLTAFEISQCHFNNTELVVLSACNTGLGDIRDFEGVYGLQRAFKMAGVRYLIMSLWPAPDEPTRELMQTFYQNLTAGQPIPSAFQKAVDKQRQRYPHPYYWAGFVLLE